MRRYKKLTPERRAFINSLITYYQPKDAGDVQGMVKHLLGDILRFLLKAEVMIC